MRADTARRFAGVINGFPARSLGTGLLGFAGTLDLVPLDDSFDFAAGDGFGVTARSAGRNYGGAQPNLN